MARILLTIEKCTSCPYCNSEKIPGSLAVNYFCSIDNKKIAGYVEWDSEIPKVPFWCKCRIEKIHER